MIGEYKDMNFLVLGDIMLDRYTIGEVNRISPEAPVQIVNVKYQYDVLGGAANCARNIASITGKNTVDILGYFDPMDDAGKVIQKLLNDEGIFFYLMTDNNKRPTTVKERIYSGNHPLLRIDTEVKTPIPFEIPLNWLESTWLDRYDYIIISDYAKGVITSSFMEYFTPYVNKIIIDPKPENWARYPSGVLLMTPNDIEHGEMRYRQPDYPQYVLITKGKDGMTLSTKGWSKSIKSLDVENSSVIGAGDTVTAIMAVSLQRGVDMVRSARIANACAGYVVSQPGTAVVPKDVYEDIFIKESMK